MTKFVALVSGKGGVGKTTTAINLGFALNRIGRDVTIVDCFSSSLRDYLGLNVKISLHDVLAGNKHIHEATYIHPSGVKVVPSHTAPQPQRTSLSQALLDLYGKSEIVLLDGTSGYGADTKELFEVADEALFISGPDVHSAQSLLKLTDTAERLGTVVLGTVVNNHSNQKNEAQEMLKKYGHSVVSVVPYDRNIPRSFSVHLPVLISYPGSPSSVQYHHLAELFWKHG